jgi:hypothetical protein
MRVRDRGLIGVLVGLSLTVAAVSGAHAGTHAVYATNTHATFGGDAIFQFLPAAGGAL